MSLSEALPQPAESGPFRRPLFTWKGLLESAGLFVGAATLLGWLGRFGWVFELASHFKVQLTMAFALLAGLAALGRHGRLALALLAGVAANAIPVLMAILPLSRTPSAGAPSVRLMAVNVFTANRETDRVVEAIQRADPDLVLLLEVNHRWMEALAPIRSNYSVVLAESREDNFGIALFSRWPVHNFEVLELGEVPVPSLSAAIKVGDQIVQVLGTHPVPPSSPDGARERNRQLRAVAEWARTRTGPAVVLGDLNATPWSPYFRDLIRDSGLVDARPHLALFNTWPAGFLPLRIPLDHCLVSPELGVRSRSVGGDVGSDHFPIHVELVVPPK